MEKVILKLENVLKSYSDKVGYKIHLLEDVNLSVEENSFVTILAPVGAGKSSLLKIIAGLEIYDSGNISYTQKEKVVFIPSKPSSFPWFSVKENIKIVDEKSDEDRINEIISLVELKGYEDHFPNNKSIGFRFRISLARALAINPAAVLLDEPFAEMKIKTREEIYELIKKVKAESGTTFLLATTNISEAIILSDKIYLMSKQPGRTLDEISLSNEEKTPNFIERTKLRIQDKLKEILNRNFFDFRI